MDFSKRILNKLKCFFGYHDFFWTGDKYYNISENGRTGSTGSTGSTGRIWVCVRCGDLKKYL